jgi:hypothetical protein
VSRPKPRPVTQNDYDQVRALHAQGLGRNDIARKINRSGQVVSRLAGEMELSFARAPEVAAATEVRVADLAERRTRLATDLQGDAERLREQLWQPARVFAFAGKDGDYQEQLLPEPPPADKRALMATLGTAVDRSLKLVPPLDDTGEDAARSMLGKLADGIARLAGTDTQPEEDTGEG